MGRYSFFLLKNLVKNDIFSIYPEIVLLFNKNLSLNLINDFEGGLFNEFTIDAMNYPHVKASKANILENRQALDNHLNENYSTHEISFLMLSAFELGQSLSVFPSKSFNMLLFYDLIPMLFANAFLKEKNVTQDYFSRFNQIFEADLIFSISNTTKNDLISYLNISKDKIINIGGGSINPSNISRKPKLKIIKPYYLFPSGDSWQKNNENAIKAFGMFNKDNRYSLIITSNFNEETQIKLKNGADKIFFSGRVTDEEMLWLYRNSEGVMFPSVYEGLGLPVLEAVQQGKPILLSNIGAFKEFGIKNFIWCDPYDINDIARGLNELQNILIDETNYKKILKKYNWQNTAKTLLKSIASINENDNKQLDKRKKIALVGPSPNSYSAIGKFCLELLPAITEMADVDFYYETPPSIKNFKQSYFQYVWNCFPILELLKNYPKYDKIIYNIGNSEHHVLTYFIALLEPDVLILHDIDLAGLNSVIERYFPKWHIRITDERKLESLVNKKTHAKNIISLANKQNKVIIHNTFSLKHIKKMVLDGDTKIIKQDLPIATPDFQQPKVSKNKLTIAVASLISYDKGLNSIIKIIRKFSNYYRFIIFGYTFHDQAFLELAKMDSENLLELHANVSDFKYNLLLKQADYLINLRPVYHGEASRSVLEGFRSGVIPIVSNIGWFSELSEELAIKINSEQDLNDLLANEAALRKYRDNYDFNNLYNHLCSISYKKYVEKILE